MENSHMMNSEFNKALVALIMSALIVVELILGIQIPGISEDWIIATIAILTPILVWLVPN